MNKYLEKIASFRIPRALTRYANSNSGIKESLKALNRQAKGSSDTRLNAASGAAKKHFNKQQYSHDLHTKFHDEMTSEIQRSKDVHRAMGTDKRLSDSLHDKAEDRAWDPYFKSLKERSAAKTRAERTEQAANLGTKGAKKTLATMKGIAAGTGVVGAGATIAYNKSKKK